MNPLLTIFFYAAAGLAALLAFSWVLPLIAPFLIAFVSAAAMEPVVSNLHRRGGSRNLAAGILTALLLTVFGAVCTIGTARVLAALSDLARRMPELLHSLSQTLSEVQERILSLFQDAPGTFSRELGPGLDALLEQLYAIPLQLSETFLTALTDWAKRSPDLLLFLATTAIGIYFFSASYRQILDFLKKQIPPGSLSRVQRAWGRMKGTVRSYLRVQGLLICVTFAELLAAFLLLRIPSAPSLAAATALIDALPILGVGAVLLPWALWCLLTHSLSRGLGLLVTWAIISAVRNAIQAKLMDVQMGLPPVVSLMSLYIGWKVCGISGTILLPLAIVVLKQLYDLNLLPDWKKT